MIGIYKITSPTKKIYIGQSVNIKNRFSKYKSKGCRSQTKLYNSFVKHGVDKHTFEVLEECLESELNEKERYYQDLYHAVGKNGLNCRLTGTDEKSGYVSQETRDKLRDLMLGKKRPDWVREKLRQANIGKVMSQESREKMSKNNAKFFLGKKRPLESRLLVSKNNKMKRKTINSETGVIYNSIKEASEKEGIEYSKLRQYLRCKTTKKTNIKYYEE